VNLDVIAKRYGLAGSEEIEGVVRQAVGNGRRTVVVVAGSGDCGEIDLDRRDVSELLGVQRRGDVAVRRVLVDKAAELHQGRRRVAGIVVDPVELEGDGVGVSGIMGPAGEFGNREGSRGLAVGTEDHRLRRPGNMVIGVVLPGLMLLASRCRRS